MASPLHHEADGSHLAQLPAEMLEHVFMWLDAESLVTVASLCRMFRGVVKGNQSLWRRVYFMQMVCWQSQAPARRPITTPRTRTLWLM